MHYGNANYEAPQDLDNANNYFRHVIDLPANKSFKTTTRPALLPEEGTGSQTA